VVGEKMCLNLTLHMQPSCKYLMKIDVVCVGLVNDDDDKILHACGDLQILVPCGSKDVVCARGREWASNSTDFCHLAGFALEGVDIKLRNGAQVSCYDGRGEPASSMGEKRGSSKKKESKAQKSTSLLDMLNDWAEHVGVSEKVLWAIGGLVLTAGAALLRCILPPSIRVVIFLIVI
jgi:hypothetical protein